MPSAHALQAGSRLFGLWPGHAYFNRLSGQGIEDQHGRASPVTAPVERWPMAAGSRHPVQLRTLGEWFVYPGPWPEMRPDAARKGRHDQDVAYLRPWCPGGRQGQNAWRIDMASDRSGERAALDAEVEETQSTIAKLREAVEGTEPGHSSRVALKKAEEKLAELVKHMTRRDRTG